MSLEVEGQVNTQMQGQDKNVVFDIVVEKEIILNQLLLA